MVSCKYRARRVLRSLNIGHSHELRHANFEYGRELRHANIGHDREWRRFHERAVKNCLCENDTC